jgi:hypothetical protein
MTSSKISRLPDLLQAFLSASLNPATGGNIFLLPATGSRLSQAMSLPFLANVFVTDASSL